MQTRCSEGGGQDEFVGKSGSDILVGGGNSDKYIFSRNSGVDVLEDSGGASDVIVLDDGILLDELTIYETSGGLNVQIGPNSNQDRIQIVEWGWLDNYIETFVVDGKEHPYEEIEQKIEGNRRPRTKDPLSVQKATVG